MTRNSGASRPWRVKPVIFGFSAAFLVAAAGGSATDIGPWYQALAKPIWNPPDWLFGPAWTIIFACIAMAGIDAWINAQTKAQRQRILLVFAINALLNIGWSELFFTLRRPDWSVIEVVFLWLSIIAMMRAVSPVSLRSVRLLSAYLAWVTFAGILNLEIVRLNPATAG